MKTTFVWLSVLLLACLGNPRDSGATEPFAKVSTYSFQFLRFPVSARNLAMGSVGAADDVDPRNQYYNPAVLYPLDGFAVGGGRVSWIADVDFDDYAAQAGNLLPTGCCERVRVAAAVRYTVMKMPGTVERTVFLPEGTGRILNPRDRNITFALAGGWYAGRYELGAGFAVKRLSQDLVDKEFRGWAYDLGVVAKATFGREAPVRLIPSIGLSVLNLGSGVDYGDRKGDLPREGRAGVRLRLEASHVEFAGRDVPFVSISGVADYVDSPWRQPNKRGVGLDVGLIDVVHFRLGYIDGLGDDLDGLSSRGFGLDWTVRKLRFTLDYAYYEIPSVLQEFPEAEAYSGAVSFAF